MSRTPEHNEILLHASSTTAADIENLRSLNWFNYRRSPRYPRPLAQALEDLYRTYRCYDRVKSAEVNDYLANVIALAPTHSVIKRPETLERVPTEVCLDAEQNFDTLVRQMNKTLDSAESHDRVSVYHDTHGVPLFLRKSREVSTALALKSFQLSGSELTVPAGTLVGIGPSRPEKITGVKHVTRHGLYEEPITTLQSIAFDGETDPVQPLRLSAWAFVDPLDRALFAVSGDEICDSPTGRVEMLCSNSLEGFQKIGQQLVELCQMEGTQLVPTPPLGDVR